MSPVGLWLLEAGSEKLLACKLISPTDIIHENNNEISREAAKQLEQYFLGKRESFDLPLEFEKYSSFSRHVWEAVSGIPFGSTASYLDIAIKVSTPEAVRAVGRANGKNPYPVIIPCHRVIGNDSSLTGYAYGTHIKRWLLEHEGVIARQGNLF